MTGLLVILAAAGCSEDTTGGSAPDPASIEEAARKTGLATIATLISADAFEQPATLGLRDAGACPLVTSDSEGGGMLLTVDYGDGCMPDSGFYASAVAGSGALSWTEPSGVLTTDGLSSAGATLAGRVDGTWSEEGGVSFVTLTSDLHATGTLVADLVQETTVRFDTDGIRIEGATTLEIAGEVHAVAVALEGVEMSYDPRDACPLPNAGTAVLMLDTDTYAFTFHEDTPSTGEVDLVWAGYAYEGVPICDAPAD